MKKSMLIRLFVFIGLFAGWQLSAQAQYEDMIKNSVNEALEKYLVNVSPPKGCECNDCLFVYEKAMKIERTRKYEEKLLVWGKAKTSYTSKFSGGGGRIVDFYAEVVKEGSDFVVTKLKWKGNDCMKLESLFEM